MYTIIGSDQKQYGPVTADQVRQWLTEGRINGQTLAQADNSTDWRPLAAYPEFSADLIVPAVPPERPGSIKAFGIMNIIFGSLALLCGPLSLLGLSAMEQLPQPIPMHWLKISAVLTMCGGAVMLTSGIGLTLYKSWGRKLAVYYSIFALIMAVFNLMIVLNAFSADGSVNTAERTGRIVGAVVGSIIGMIYHLVLVILLSKKQAKQAVS